MSVKSWLFGSGVKSSDTLSRAKTVTELYIGYRFNTPLLVCTNSESWMLKVAQYYRILPLLEENVQVVTDRPNKNGIVTLIGDLTYKVRDRAMTPVVDMLNVFTDVGANNEILLKEKVRGFVDSIHRMTSLKMRQKDMKKYSHILSQSVERNIHNILKTCNIELLCYNLDIKITSKEELESAKANQQQATTNMLVMEQSNMFNKTQQWVHEVRTKWSPRTLDTIYEDTDKSAYEMYKISYGSADEDEKNSPLLMQRLFKVNNVLNKSESSSDASANDEARHNKIVHNAKVEYFQDNENYCSSSSSDYSEDLFASTKFAPISVNNSYDTPQTRLNSIFMTSQNDVRGEISNSETRSRLDSIFMTSQPDLRTTEAARSTTESDCKEEEDPQTEQNTLSTNLQSIYMTSEDENKEETIFAGRLNSLLLTDKNDTIESLPQQGLFSSDIPKYTPRRKNSITSATNTETSANRNSGDNLESIFLTQTNENKPIEKQRSIPITPYILQKGFFTESPPASDKDIKANKKERVCSAPCMNSIDTGRVSEERKKSLSFPNHEYSETEINYENLNYEHSATVTNTQPNYSETSAANRSSCGTVENVENDLKVEGDNIAELGDCNNVVGEFDNLTKTCKRKGVYLGEGFYEQIEQSQSSSMHEKTEEKFDLHTKNLSRNSKKSIKSKNFKAQNDNIKNRLSTVQIQSGDKISNSPEDSQIPSGGKIPNSPEDPVSVDSGIDEETALRNIVQQKLDLDFNPIPRSPRLMRPVKTKFRRFEK